MHHRTINTRELKVRCYNTHMIDINEYLDALRGTKSSDKNVEMELNEIFLNRMPNGRSK